jgi:hypothetical protein
MPWQVYLSGEIHTDWRARIVDGAPAGLDVAFTGPVTDHAAGDDAGAREPDQVVDRLRYVVAGALAQR